MMNFRICKTLLLITVTAFAPATSFGNSANEAGSLDTRQLGHVRHIIDSARQLPGDWRYMEPRAMLTYDAYQFQLAFMSYALAIVQVNYTPAYKELYREAQLSLIEKMMRPDVWAPTWLEIIEWSLTRATWKQVRNGVIPFVKKISCTAAISCR